jgi:hypothetical protein
LLLAITGISCAFLTKNMLQNNPLQSGKDAVGLLVPPFLTAVFFAIIGYNKGFTKKLFVISLLLFIIQFIPFWEALFQVVKPAPKEDFARYISYAQNMITNHTLWGGDQIHFKKEGLSYITQPGIRYVIALELLLFGKLYRFVSVLNILLFTSCLFLFLKAIKENIANTKIQVLLFTLFILSVPYAVKNILMGIPEWFTVSLLMASVYFYFTKKFNWVAFILLAMVPFIRQNILPAVLLLLICYLYEQKNKKTMLAMFVAVLLLPVYHNLYYAGELKFFTSIFKWPFLKYESWQSRVPAGFFPQRIGNNFLHYFGFDWMRLKRFDFIEEAFLFLWLFGFAFFYCGKTIFNPLLKKSFYLSSIFLIILPQLLMATDYYPRFEFVNIYLIIVLFIFIYHFQQKNPEFGVWEFIGLKNKLKQSV